MRKRDEYYKMMFHWELEGKRGINMIFTFYSFKNLDYSLLWLQDRLKHENQCKKPAGTWERSFEALFLPPPPIPRSLPSYFR